MKTIVFYGDSNTWGYVPVADGAEAVAQRYPWDVRWPGVVARLLGAEYHVIEEGLNGRTTAMHDVFGKYRNGAKYLGACLTTNQPVDLLVFMLGSNDTKKHLRASSAVIGRGIEKLIRIARSCACGPDGGTPRILIIAPAHIREEIFDSWLQAHFDHDAIQKSRELAERYYGIARRNDCYFMNAAVYTEAGALDGLHLDAEGHAKLAEAVAVKIKEIFSDD